MLIKKAIAMNIVPTMAAITQFTNARVHILIISVNCLMIEARDK